MPPAPAPLLQPGHSAAHAVWPLWLGVILLLALAASAVALAIWWRRGALRAWRAFAAETGGEFAARGSFSPGHLSARWRGRDLLLTTGIAQEDEAPYYHTRAALPIRNPSGFILGLRRKSLLEEAQTRRDAVGETGIEDAEFERRFLLVCNDAGSLPGVLNAGARAELTCYSDVEIYVRLDRIEWRRAGEQADIGALRRLTDVIAGMADTIDSLPGRKRPLSECLADQAWIEKGI